LVGQQGYDSFELEIVCRVGGFVVEVDESELLLGTI